MSAYWDSVVTLALDLINSYDPMLEIPEALPTPDELERFLDRRGFPSTDRLDEAHVREVHALRDRFRAAILDDALTALVQAINTVFAQYGAIPQLATHNTAWILELYAQPETTLIERLALETAAGLATVLQRYGMERLRVCAALPCREVFVDLSRNQSRRYCSDRCANRHNIAAYRQRQLPHG